MSLVIKNLHFAYDHRTVLSGISVTAAQGSITALLGPNATGKSTLLRCIIGALKPLKGRVLIDGKTSHTMKARKLAARVAYVPQISNVTSAFTVRDVIEFGRYALPVDDSKIAQVISHLHLSDLADRPYPELSVGQQQRVMLARALAQVSNNGYLILDEPTAAMDLRYIHHVMILLRELAANGVTVVMAMHDISLAASVADEVWLLNEGKLVAKGEIGGVLTVGSLEAVFGVPFQWIKDLQGNPRLIDEIIMPGSFSQHS